MMGNCVVKTQEDYEFLKQEVVELKTRADKAADNGEIRDKIKRNKNMLVTKVGGVTITSSRIYQRRREASYSRLRGWSARS